MLGKVKNLFKKNIKQYTDKTVLIVDDNPVDRRIIEKTLVKLGCHVLTAVDGEIGYHVALSEVPNLILADCNMPNLDGMTMCRKLREEEPTRNVPIIFLTGQNSPQTVVDCFELGAANYMCKPINSKVLTTQIIAILEEHLPSE